MITHLIAGNSRDGQSAGKALLKKLLILASIFVDSTPVKETRGRGFSITATFNDYPDGEYGQVTGKGARPVALAG